MDWKKMGKKLLFPPVWLTVLLVLVSAAGLIYVFTGGMEQSILAYVVYALSAYTLTAVSLFCALVLPKKLGEIKKLLYDNPVSNRFLTDRAFRTNVSLCASFGAGVLYVGINLWSWYMLRSWWFVVLAVYYGIMSVMRFLLMGYLHSRKVGADLPGEWKRARSCACTLLLVNLSLSGAVLMILYQSKGYDYPGVLIYVMALYTFYATIHAIVDIVRYRRLGSPVMTTAKIVSLSGALVSMLNLETAMFAQFGQDMPLQTQRLFIILTGGGVSITVVTLSVILIVTANKQIGRTQHGK